MSQELKDQFQTNFAAMHPELYDRQDRIIKAKKMLAVLKDHLGADSLKQVKLLDFGCSTGILTEYLSGSFKETVGVDIDEGAIEFAQKIPNSSGLSFELIQGLTLPFPDCSFDVIICSQVYEHVPDPEKLLKEIYRLLKPNGVCFFSAGNRLKYWESHYDLPLLSVVPKWLGHLYVRLAGKAKFYYETHLFVWQLRALVSDFQVIDYTRKVIAEPNKFCLTDMLNQGSVKQRLALFLVDYLYFLCPNYIWILQKAPK